MSDQLHFYFAPETCSLASMIALEDVGADYVLHALSIGQQQHNAKDYLKINPKGRVPALVIEQGVLTETPAILAYIAQRFPQAQIAPVDDPFAFAKLQEFNSFMASTLHVAHAHRMRGHRWVDDENAKLAMQAKVPETVLAAFQYLEDNYLDGPFVFGARYTVADPYLFTFAQWLEADGVDPARLPKVAAHRAMMRSRKAVQTALAKEGA